MSHIAHVDGCTLPYRDVGGRPGGSVVAGEFSGLWKLARSRPCMERGLACADCRDELGPAHLIHPCLRGGQVREQKWALLRAPWLQEADRVPLFDKEFQECPKFQRHLLA